MRVISGLYKSRKLQPLSAQSKIRPIRDNQKEVIFNILTHNTDCWQNERPAYVEAKVLDVFAGTGSLGIEALSQGAISVDFVDIGQESHKIIQQNINRLNIEPHKIKLWKKNALYLGAATQQYNLIFLDPPYGHNSLAQVLERLHAKKWLAAKAVCIVKISTRSTLTLPDFFSIIMHKQTKDETIFFLRYQ